MFKITLGNDQDYSIPVLKLAGELDLSVYSCFERNLSRVLLRSDDRVVLDFKGISFVDSYMIRLLREYNRVAVDNGGEIYFVNLLGYNKTRLDLAGVNRSGNSYFVN